MRFYEAGASRSGGSFDQGIEQVVAAVLASPEFLYRAIRGLRSRRATEATGDPQTASLRSPIWNWLRVFPSSCGIPVPTRNC